MTYFTGTYLRKPRCPGVGKLTSVIRRGLGVCPVCGFEGILTVNGKMPNHKDRRCNASGDYTKPV